MAEGKVSNLAIWNEFFSKAKKGVDYEAYLHCSEPLLCKKAKLDRTFEMVKTVPSAWCQDLVSPMNALLAAALGNHTGRVTDSGHENDKFIFLSGSTVPLKSFSFVQRKLTVTDGHKSNFCVQEWPKWALYEGEHVLPKTSQWMILSRTHALNAMAIAKVFTPKQMMRQMVPLRWAGTDWLAAGFWQIRKQISSVTHSPVIDSFLTSFLVPAVRGCADEFWHMAATVGVFEPNRLKKGVSFEDLSGGLLSMKEADREQLQGHCDTFALVDADDSTKNLHLIEGNGTSFGGQSGFLGLRPHIHAGKFLTVSKSTLEALASSSYLFARKMDDTTKLIDGTELLGVGSLSQSDTVSMSLPKAFNEIIFAHK